MSLKSFYMSRKRKRGVQRTEHMRNVYVAVAVVWHLQLHCRCRLWTLYNNANA